MACLCVDRNKVNYRELRDIPKFKKIIEMFYSVSDKKSHHESCINNHNSVNLINHLINPIVFFKCLDKEPQIDLSNSLDALFRGLYLIHRNEFELLLKYWREDKNLPDLIQEHFLTLKYERQWKMDIIDCIYGEFLETLENSYEKIYNELMIGSIIL